MDDPRPFSVVFEEARARTKTYFERTASIHRMLSYAMGDEGEPDQIVTDIKTNYGPILLNTSVAMMAASAQDDNEEYEKLVDLWNGVLDEMIMLLLIRGADVGIENSALRDLLDQVPGLESTE